MPVAEKRLWQNLVCPFAFASVRVMIGWYSVLLERPRVSIRHLVRLLLRWANSTKREIGRYDPDVLKCATSEYILPFAQSDKPEGLQERISDLTVGQNYPVMLFA